MFISSEVIGFTEANKFSPKVLYLSQGCYEALSREMSRIGWTHNALAMARLKVIINTERVIVTNALPKGIAVMTSEYEGDLDAIKIS